MRALGVTGLAVLAGLLIAAPAYSAVKMRMIGGRPVVEGVYVNGAGPYRFLIDTGTSVNHLDEHLARAIGLKPAFRVELITSTGTTYAPGVAGVEVAMDSIRVDRQEFLFAGIDTVHQLSSEIQGVLGQVFLSRFDYLLDLRSKRFEVGKQATEPGQIRTPFRTAEGLPLVRTSLGNLILDSGTLWVTLFGAEAGGVTRQMVTMTGTTAVGTASDKVMTVGPKVWRGQALVIPRAAESVAAGLLPLSLFKSVYVCNSEGYMVFD